MKRDPDRWLRLWLWTLNLTVLSAGLVWAAAGNRRALFLSVFVPVALAPISFARLRAHQALRRHLPRRAWSARAMALYGIAGVLCDGTMLAQLLTARSESPVPVLQAPGVNWVGSVWFSAHA